ncbi:ubiquitin receptor RAD23c [Jatropha curcas]|uniref:ubiquitin receptor RAD23c n=1 Tax=Jatropha curcas TaxID=180498 RepID=UPI0018959A9B|nr:ubiquitin receptor RAD23c [Jatropha curcas]
MKVFVKTLKGTNFEIEVKPDETVADVKKFIETAQGADVYPAEQQMLIYQGKVLKDSRTLEEIKVAENSFFVVMLSKSKVSSGGASAASTATPSPAQPASSLPSRATQPSTTTEAPAPTAAPWFQALRTMVQANPQILQPMLQELGKQNPHLMRLIQEHQADFLRLINEPVEGEG